MTKLNFINLLTITKTTNTTRTIRTKIVNLNFNELLIKIEKVFDLAKATTIKIIQD